MGLNMSQVFLRRYDMGRLSKILGPTWLRHLREDPEHPCRQLVLLPNSPWTTLLDSTNQFPRELATELSKSAGGEAVWISVGSTMLSYSVLRIVDGEPLEDRTYPKPDPEGLIPWYIDPEQSAWEYLFNLGLPPAYRYLRIREIEILEKPPDQKADLVLFERSKPGAALAHGLYRHRIKNPRTEESGPPTEYSVYKKDERKLYDLYLIQGNLIDERLDHLLLVLDQIARRKLCPPDHTYSPVVTAIDPKSSSPVSIREIIQRRFDILSRSRKLSYSL